MYLVKSYKGNNLRVNCITQESIKDNQDEIFLRNYRESFNNKEILDSQNILDYHYF